MPKMMTKILFVVVVMLQSMQASVHSMASDMKCKVANVYILKAHIPKLLSRDVGKRWLLTQAMAVEESAQER